MKIMLQGGPYNGKFADVPQNTGSVKVGRHIYCQPGDLWSQCLEGRSIDIRRDGVLILFYDVLQSLDPEG